MKKFWENYRVAIVIVVLLGLFVGLSFLLKDDNATTMSGEATVSAWVNDSLKEEYTVAVIAQTGCSWCQQYEPEFENVAEDYEGEVNFYWFHTDKISNSDYTTLSSTYDIEDKFTGTPFTMLTYHGVLIDSISGYVDEETLVDFLKENGAISE